MIDSSRRTVLTTGAAAAAATAAPQVFAQAPAGGGVTGLAGRRQGRLLREGQCPHPLRRDRLGLPAAGDARRRLELAHQQSGRHAVINILEEFKNDFRVITMDQRNATSGEFDRPGPGRQSVGRVRRRPARRDGPSRHRPVLLLRQLHRRPVRDEADGARAAARRRRDPEPAGRAPAGEAGLHVRLRHATSGPRSSASAGPTCRWRPSRSICTTFTACSPTSCTACRATSRSPARRRCWCCPTTSSAHPLQVSIDIASLAPNAEITVFPWKEPPELKARTINRARTFLKRYQTA